MLTGNVGPGGYYKWQAQPGYEIIDLINKRRLVALVCNNTTNNIVRFNVYRAQDSSLEVVNAVPYWEPIPPKTQLPEPEFSLEEIELSRKLLGNED